jgi:hypothetical protein
MTYDLSNDKNPNVQKKWREKDWEQFDYKPYNVWYFEEDCLVFWGWIIVLSIFVQTMAVLTVYFIVRKIKEGYEMFKKAQRGFKNL